MYIYMYIYIYIHIYIYIYIYIDFYISLSSPVIQLCRKNSETTELTLTLMGKWLHKCFSSQGSIYYIDVSTSCSHMKWAYWDRE